jgi:dienelactone hydrolase
MRKTSSSIVGLIAALAIAGCGKDKQADRPPAAPGPAAKAGPAPEPATDEPATDEPPAQPGQAATLQTEEVEYKAGDLEMIGYLAFDPAIPGKRPGVLVVHEWWGHNRYTRERAEQLAKMGYIALAVDMYGGGKQAAHPDDAGKFSSEVMSNMDGARARFEAGMKVLQSHPATDPEKIAAIGYCFGGGIVLAMARAGLDLDGVASFHGMLGTKTPAKKGEVKAKVLVLHGDADPFVPAEQVEAFKKEMAGAAVDMKFVGYPGAKHAFTNPDATEVGKKFNLPVEYDQQADEKSWAELDQFLRGLFPR